jgi:hypothetical protein
LTDGESDGSMDHHPPRIFERDGRFGQTCFAF